MGWGWTLSTLTFPISASCIMCSIHQQMQGWLSLWPTLWNALPSLRWTVVCVQPSYHGHIMCSVHQQMQGWLPLWPTLWNALPSSVGWTVVCVCVCVCVCVQPAARCLHLPADTGLQSLWPPAAQRPAGHLQHRCLCLPQCSLCGDWLRQAAHPLCHLPGRSVLREQLKQLVSSRWKSCAVLLAWGYSSCEQGCQVMVMIAVISIVPYLTSKGEHTALYEISKIVYIKPSKNNDYVLVILYSLHTISTPTHTHAHTQKCKYMYLCMYLYTHTHVCAYAQM